MKTLKESLLGNTEDALAAGDNMTVTVEEQFKALAKDVINIKSYRKINYGWTGVKYLYYNWHVDYGPLDTLFDFLGYGCNAQFSVSFMAPDLPDVGRNNNWTLTVGMISFTNAGAERTFFYQIEVPHVKTLVSAISKYIKPAFKNINAFKKFLNDLEKNGTYIQ